MTEPLQAVLLDIDDTLLDTRASMIEAGTVATRAVWPHLPGEWHERASQRFYRDPAGLFGRFTRGELSFDDMRAQRLAEVATAFEVAAPADASTTYERAFRPAFNAIQRVYDDVAGLLDACAERGLTVGALTNSSDGATRDKLEVTGLGERFAVVVTRDTLGFGKPDARVFRHACDRLGADPARTLYVGDELVPDALGSRDAGLMAHWLRRPPGAAVDLARDFELDDQPAPDGVRIVSSLNEIRLF